MVLSFLLVLFGAVSIYILFPWLVKILLRKRFLKRIMNSRCTCFTFDDGPNPLSTPHILDLLQEAKVKATFFVLGKNAEKYPEIISEMIKNGHEVEEHSYEHSHAFKTGPFKTAKDLMRGGRVVERLLTSSNARFIRPPYGKLNIISLFYIWLRRRGVVFWNVDPRDYANLTAEPVADFVIPRLNPGSVILLHDARMDTGETAEVTVRAVKCILEKAALLDLNFVTVKQALALAANNGND